MQNLQDLYDFYLSTKPSRGKIKSATTLLIHICKALQTISPEEIGQEMFSKIPQALDEMYYSTQHKAINDKSTLAEMIGRFGPQNGWDETFEILLDDRDENLRQFTLNTLEYVGKRNPAMVLPYIERYRKSSDLLMRDVSANLAGKILSFDQEDVIKRAVWRWINEGDTEFINEIIEALLRIKERLSLKEETQQYDVAIVWLQNQLGKSGG
ncbi:MAG TPA: hypothetical protein EYP36_11890 [Calditrichaeota bacterium]|nr:hypothetical protein [Calditrichota bacterium]